MVVQSCCCHRTFRIRELFLRRLYGTSTRYAHQRPEQDMFCSSSPSKDSVLSLSEQDRTKTGHTCHLQLSINCIMHHIALPSSNQFHNFVKIIVLFLNKILYFTLSKQLFTGPNKFSDSLRTSSHKPSGVNYTFKAFLLFSHSDLRKSNKKIKKHF